MPYATVSDVEIYAEPGHNEEKIETLLDQAEVMIRREFADLDERVVDGRTDVLTVKQVESEMVAAFLANPQGLRSTSDTRTEGPFSQNRSLSFSAGDTLIGGGLVLTDRHRGLLGRLRAPGPFVVPLGG